MLFHICIGRTCPAKQTSNFIMTIEKQPRANTSLSIWTNEVN